MYVGQNIRRRDGQKKVDGSARYVDDLAFEGMLHGLTLRSTETHARILSIEYDPSFDWSDIVRVEARDIPGDNVVALFKDDQPCLADGLVNHLHEPVLLLAAPSIDRVRDAAAHVAVRYEPLPAVYTMADALRGEVHVNGDEHNVLDTIHLKQGDVDAAFQAAAHVVKGRYETGYQEQLYLEPQGIIAVPRGEGELLVLGSFQCPYFIVRALNRILGIPEESLDVVQTVTGGAFGGKEEYPNIMAGHVALLAQAAGRPVKLIYDRQEDLQATTKRHPALIEVEHAVDSEGRILGIRGSFDLDAGAYATLSKVVLSRGLIHLPGPYRVPAVDLFARVVATHTVPNGAFRGFGAPQTTFAYESQMNRIARVCGLDPLQVRQRNMLVQGDATATGMVMNDPVGLKPCLDKVLEETDYLAERQRLLNEPQRGPRRRGVGLSVFLHGGGFTGSGEARFKGKVAITIEEGGRFRIRAATVEMGQGMRTTFAQIAADALQVPIEALFFGATSTREVPNSGPTVASRTAMVVGKVVHEACLKMRSALLSFAGSIESPSEDLVELAREHLRRKGPLQALASYELPPGIQWDDETHMGDAYPAYSWAAEVAWVSVDLDTGEVEVERIVNATDVGRALHPAIVEGQIEGGTLQGVGYAYGEGTQRKGGRLLNDRLATYIIPTVRDTPKMEVHLVELPFSHGPYGAKGVGEMPLDGVAPAIALAIEEAMGVEIHRIPMSPEQLLELRTASEARGGQS